MTSKHLMYSKWFVTTVLNLLTHVLQPHRYLYGISVMIKKQFFRVFQLFAPEVKHFYEKNTWKNSQIIFICENDLKHEITLAKNLLRKESKLPISFEQVFPFIAILLKKLCLIVSGSCNSSRHERFMKEKFFKNEISENNSQKFHDQ